MLNSRCAGPAKGDLSDVDALKGTFVIECLNTVSEKKSTSFLLTEIPKVFFELVSTNLIVRGVKRLVLLISPRL